MQNTAQVSGVNIPQVGVGEGLQNSISFMFALAAGIALVYVLIGALRLSVSNGEPQKVASGRQTIIYALIGMVIAISAYIIVGFVTSRAQEIEGSTNPFFGDGGLITVLVETISFIVGIASVIMLIVGGFRYITSAGQPASAQTARNTIIYALIGIVVALVATGIVSFVLERIGS